MFSNVWTITKKDFKSYFTSPTAYIIIALFMMILGWIFFSVLRYAQMAFSRQMMGGGAPLSLHDTVVKTIINNMNLILLLLVPFITMRLFAEEHKQHTIELLMTAPITLTDIILGKFFSSFGFLLVMFSCTLVFPVMLASVSRPDLGAMSASYLGSLLMATCYIGIGLFFSAMTENQIIAGSLSFIVSLFFWIVSWASNVENVVIKTVASQISLIAHFENFSLGVIQLSDVMFYLSFVGLTLFLTHRVLDSYRWR